MALKKSMLAPRRSGQRCSSASGSASRGRRLAYTLTVQQTGTGVTATGAGSINFDALALFGDEIDPSLLEASGGAIIVGPATPTDDAYYSGLQRHYWTGHRLWTRRGIFRRQRRRHHSRARHFRRNERRRCRGPAGLRFRNIPGDEHRLGPTRPSAASA
jgi:hypothetical protein